MRKLIIFLFSGTVLFACNTYQANESDKTAYAAAEASDDLYAGDSVKLIKTAGLRMKVQQVEKAAPEISTLTKNFGGMVMQYQYDAVEEYSKTIPYADDSMRVISRYTPQANMEVRVPTHVLDTFLFTISKLGYYTGNTNMQVDDRSLAYFRNVRKQQVRTDALADQRHVKRNTKDMLRHVGVQDDMIDQQIDNKAIDYDVNFSVVKIDLFQNAVLRNEVMARTDFSAYSVPFTYQFKQALQSGWKLFQQMIIAVAHLWMLIILLPIGFVMMKWMRRRFQWQSK